MRLRVLGREASDWLSPMLVKELRQGLRGTAFVVAFVLIQVVMIGSVLAMLQDTRGAADIGGGLFWSTIGLWTLAIMPGRVFSEMRREFQDRTLEITFLTRLTAWRMVAGRWAAVFLQTVLVLTAVLPYAVLRYFLGGVDLVHDLQWLAYDLVASGVIAACVLVAAAFQSRFLNGGLILIGWQLLPWLRVSTGTLATPGLGGGAFTSAGLATVAVLGAMLVVFLLELAAGRIAPRAENHALRKRLFAFGAVGVALAESVRATAPSLAVTLAGLLVMFVCMDAMCEEPLAMASTYLPFVRRGRTARCLGWFFYPGWPSGILFAVVAVAALQGTWWLTVSRMSVPRAVATSMCALALARLPGLLLLPVVVMPPTRRRWTWYAGIQVAEIVGGGLLVNGGMPPANAAVLLPAFGFFSSMTSWTTTSPSLQASAWMSAAVVGALLLRRRAALAVMRAGEQRALARMAVALPAG